MDKKLKAKWVKALRSGDYQQGEGVLRSGDRFCCLGVLCDLVDSKAWDQPAEVGYMLKSRTKKTIAYRFTSGRERDRYEIPYMLRKDLGITTFQQSELIGMNDEGRPFAAIADFIEREL